MKRSRQASLFDEPASETDAATLVAIDLPKAKLTPAQKTFNRLTAQIQRQREALAAWDDYQPRFLRRFHDEYTPVLARLRDSQRELVRVIDALLNGEYKGGRLARRDRALLEDQLLALVDDVLSDGSGDEEMARIRERYSGLSHEDALRMEMEMAEAFLGGMLGEDMIDAHGAEDIDELFRVVGDRHAQREAERACKRASKQGGRVSKAAERKAQEEREASESVRDLYRKLARGLHPDREPDPAERARKTELMQRANRAYEANDLLTLLTLQVEAEHIDEEAADVPPQRLARYNRVLREQLEALKMESMQRIVVFAQMLGADLPLHACRPRDVEASFSTKLAELTRLAMAIDDDRAALADSKRRREVLAALRAEYDTPSVDADIFEALDALFGDDAVVSDRRKKRR
jgi:hypothetical protein